MAALQEALRAALADPQAVAEARAAIDIQVGDRQGGCRTTEATIVNSPIVVSLVGVFFGIYPPSYSVVIIIWQRRLG